LSESSHFSNEVDLGKATTYAQQQLVRINCGINCSNLTTWNRNASKKNKVWRGDDGCMYFFMDVWMMDDFLMDDG